MEQKPKALAACTAVLELLDAGVDINIMTVSQVAEQAGVGKGTLYDYFTSKEDMVVSAMAYEVQRIAESLSEKVNRESGFEQKVYRIFACMEEHTVENKGVCRFVKLSNHTFSMGNALHEEMERRKNEFGGLYQVLESLCRDAREEGLILPAIPMELAVMTLATKFLMFLMYLESRQEMKDMDPASMKRFLYKGLLADLHVS